MPLVTLTTDFGLADPYVAAMKGVLLGIAPDARIVDISHDIGAQNVAHAAFVFRQAFEFFPAGTIHLVVVDPGVGSRRRLIAARIAEQVVLAPDNGAITHVMQDFGAAALREIANPAWRRSVVSATFHGRDIFAPAAGQLAAGAPFDEIGPPIDRPVLLDLPAPSAAPDGTLTGCVIHVDRFGNLITNLRRSRIESMFAPAEEGSKTRPAASVHVGLESIGPIRRAYSDVAPRALLALFSSGDLLEIALRDGSAADRFKACVGAGVTVRPTATLLPPARP